MRKILLIVMISLGFQFAYGQVDSLVCVQNGLLKNEVALNQKLDSLQVMLNTNRNEYSKTNSAEIANVIIDLENEIYDIKTELSKLGVKLSQNEAMLERSGFDATYAGRSLKSVSNIYSSNFFRENVSAKELTIITKNNEASLSKLAEQGEKTYKRLAELKELYNKAQTQEEVNSMIQEAVKIKNEISSIDQQASALWSDVYQHKIDNYVVLVDKIGSVGRDKLEIIDQLGREVVQNESVFSNGVAPTLAILPFQKRLVIGYELALAQELKISKAIDSLNKSQSVIKSGCKFDDIAFPYKSMIIYGDITIGNDYTYESLDDIAQLKLPTSGLYYAVQVAYVTGKVSSLSIFKGALPLQQEIIGSKTRYVLGGFRTYQDAVVGVKDCYKYGFKSPVVVAWLDGKSVSVQSAQAYQKSNPVAQYASGYKVVVETSDIQIANRLKPIADIHAKGKVISRVSSKDGYIYTIATFNLPEEAKVFAQILKTEFSEINVDVLSVE